MPETRPCRMLPAKEADALWFSTIPAMQEKAATLCFDCPAMTECSKDGQTEEYGVWGGTFPDDPIRVANVRKARKAAAAAEYGEMLALVGSMTADGMSASAIAADLGIGQRTVFTYRAALARRAEKAA